MPDEQLNELGDIFVALQVQTLFRLSFEQFLEAPEGWVNWAARLHAGDGICIADGQARVVQIN